MVPFSYCGVLTSHVTVLLLHSVVPLFFFLTFDGIIFTLYITNITCDCTFFTFGGSLIFSHIWRYHSHIVQYQHHTWLYFCHIQLFFFFFSHLMVPSSHCAISTSHVTVFCHILWYLYFFLTFDGTILILRSTNITCDLLLSYLIVLFFSHFMVPSSHYAVPTSHVTILLSYSVIPLFFFLIFYGTSLKVQY